MHLSETHLLKITADFSTENVEQAKSELARLSPNDTWNSYHNFNSAIGAILDLSKGDVVALRSLVDAARSDFRDVIYWSMLENKKTEHPE